MTEANGYCTDCESETVIRDGRCGCGSGRIVSLVARGVVTDVTQEPGLDAAGLEAELREGDIYRWRWKDDARHNDCGPYRSYHCKSQIAIVQDGHLHDTYWSSGGSDRWLDPEKVTLSFWANTSDLTEIKKYDVDYYRREDIVDLRHSNNSSGPIYLRNGAERDAATMLDLIENRLDEARREIEWAQRRIEQLTNDAEKVRAGKLSEVYL